MRGFSTLEILIAITLMAIAAVSCTAIVLALPPSIANGHLALESAWDIQALLEYNVDKELTTSEQKSTTATTTFGEISTSITFATSSDTELRTGTAMWTDTNHKSRILSHGMSAPIPIWNKPINECGSTTPFAWMNPYVVTKSFTNGDLMPTADSNYFPVSSLTESSTTLVATIADSATATKPTLTLFDTSNAKIPIFLSGIDNAPSTKLGISAAVLTDSYVYSASATQPNFSTCSQGPSCAHLQIFDIHDRTRPQTISNLKLGTDNEPFAIGTGGQSSGKSIAYAGNRIYLGLTKTGSPIGDEFNIIDVHDPHTPIWLGGFHIGRSVTSIQIRNIYAYVTTDDQDQSLLILNIRDPNHIRKIASYRAPGTSIYTYAQTSSISSSTLLLGRTYAPNQPDLIALSLYSIEQPTLTGTAETAPSSTPWNVEAIRTSGNTAFVLRDTGLDIFNITNPSKLNLISSVPLPTQTTGVALTCENGALYIGSVATSSESFLTMVSPSTI